MLVPIDDFQAKRPRSLDEIRPGVDVRAKRQER